MGSMSDLANADLLEWLLVNGESRYGIEAVSQLQHALQCAHLAEISGAADTLIAACLLHDVGHLIQNDLHDAPKEDHALVGARFLAQWFDAPVTEPVRQHADAKRFLVAYDPLYFGTLSPASRRSLQWQGGAMMPAEMEAFINQPYARDALALRRWDDRAKDPAAIVPPPAHYRELLDALTPGADVRSSGR